MKPWPERGPFRGQPGGPGHHSRRAGQPAGRQKVSHTREGRPGRKHFDSKARQWDETRSSWNGPARSPMPCGRWVPLSTAMSALDYGSGSGLLASPQGRVGPHHPVRHLCRHAGGGQGKVAAQGCEEYGSPQADLSVAGLPDTHST